MTVTVMLTYAMPCHYELLVLLLRYGLLNSHTHLFTESNCLIYLSLQSGFDVLG